MSILSAADRVLLASVSPRPRIEEIRSSVDSESFPWEEMFQAARRNRVASFVVRLFENENLDASTNARRRKQLKDVERELSDRAQRANEQVHELGVLLAGVGVTPLLYKGPDFQERCYDLACPRSFGDIDIIVREDEVERSAAALQTYGYRQPPGAPSLDYYRRFRLRSIPRKRASNPFSTTTA